jgi:hypothetical protein
VELRPPEPELTDGIVTLRRLAPADAPAITAACRDPEIVRRTTEIPEGYTERHARGRIRSARHGWKDGSARVAKKAGYVEEGLLRAYANQRGTIRDDSMWSRVKELSGGTEVPPLKDSSLPLSRARCEPGLARWVPRRPPAPSAPRVERRLPLHWCWFYIEDPGHEQARGT